MTHATNAASCQQRRIDERTDDTGPVVKLTTPGRIWAVPGDCAVYNP